MAGSLVLRNVINTDLDQPAFHDRAGGYEGVPTSHRPAVKRGSGLGITQTLVQCPGSRVVMLNQHACQRPIMIDDLVFQRCNQLSPSTQGLKSFMNCKHPDIPGVLRCPEVHTTHRNQPAIRKVTHQQRDLAGVGDLEGLRNCTDMLRAS